MLKIPQIGVDPDVFVSHVVAISITDTGQIGSVGDPEPIPFPGKSLNGIEASGKLVPGIGKAILILIFENPD